MAMAASPPPQLSIQNEQAREEELDDEIVKVRAEIQSVSQQRKLLASTLLNSTRVQEKWRQITSVTTSFENQAGYPEDLNPLINISTQYSQKNAHRLAFGVTAFSFIDPNPQMSKKPLLGIRFDICKRNGTFDTPYYIICKRVDDTGFIDEGGQGNNYLRIHRHTIPALVPLERYEAKYLPLQDEGYYGSEDRSLDGSELFKQDLHALVHRVRSDLVSWRLRQEAIGLLGQELELPASKDNREKNENANQEEQIEANVGDDDDESMSNGDEVPGGKYGISEVSAIGVDAYYARIVWSDGRVGRLKISDNGTIERAVVFGYVDGENERIKSAERKLCKGNIRIDDLVMRLKELHDEQPR